MSKNKVVLFYLLALLAHVGHVLEEAWGRFWLIDAFYGLRWFFVANWILFCIPAVFFYYVLREKRWAYHMSILYAGFMILQGVGHNMATIITGKYFGGFAGGYTGIAFVFIGPPLIYYLWNARPTRSESP